jgi:hypothetical protein
MKTSELYNKKWKRIKLFFKNKTYQQVKDRGQYLYRKKINGANNIL